jgi:hypothetical protein
MKYLFLHPFYQVIDIQLFPMEDNSEGRFLNQ